jgi:hypothetical protein
MRFVHQNDKNRFTHRHGDNFICPGNCHSQSHALDSARIGQFSHDFSFKMVGNTRGIFDCRASCFSEQSDSWKAVSNHILALIFGKRCGVSGNVADFQILRKPFQFDRHQYIRSRVSQFDPNCSGILFIRSSHDTFFSNSTSAFVVSVFRTCDWHCCVCHFNTDRNACSLIFFLLLVQC